VRNSARSVRNRGVSANVVFQFPSQASQIRPMRSRETSWDACAQANRREETEDVPINLFQIVSA
jgi:hypothetical protein